MAIYVPTHAELAAIEKSLSKFQDERVRENHRFKQLFSYSQGVVCREVPKYARHEDGSLVVEKGGDGRHYLTQIGTRKLPLRRRQWIETYVKIRNKKGELAPFVLNYEQRCTEALICRLERSRLPVRIVDLKSRQIGMSTYFEAVTFESCIRGENRRALIVAHDDDTAAVVLSMSKTMLEQLPRGEGRQWQFYMKHDSEDQLAWHAPISGHMKIASARKKNPGIGFTMSILHLSESAKWEDAERKAKEMMQSLPKLPGTMAFLESTAQGDTGFFRETFWNAWEERKLPLFERRSGWHGAFFSWYEHEEYFWSLTSGMGRELPDLLLGQIQRTMQKEEEWLLTKRYMRRWRPSDPMELVDCTLENGARGKKWRRKGVGMVKVGYDQLAWRRAQIEGECGGKATRPDTWDNFNEDYPATPDQAFLASGRPAFDIARINDLLKRAAEVPPIFVGELVDTSVDHEAIEREIAAHKRMQEHAGGIPS